MPHACHLFLNCCKTFRFCSCLTRRTIPCAEFLCTFDLDTCFAPQRRGFLHQVNFQKWSEAGVFSTFGLGNALRTTTACNLSTCQHPIFISHLATWLRTCRFSEPTIRASGATNHRKNTAHRDFPTFSRTCSFFLLTLSLLWSSDFFSSPPWLFPPLLFHLSILSEVWLSVNIKQQGTHWQRSTENQDPTGNGKTLRIHGNGRTHALGFPTPSPWRGLLEQTWWNLRLIFQSARPRN